MMALEAVEVSRLWGGLSARLHGRLWNQLQGLLWGSGLRDHLRVQLVRRLARGRWRLARRRLPLLERVKRYLGVFL